MTTYDDITVLVTGATGFLAQHLIPSLLQKGANVVGMFTLILMGMVWAFVRTKTGLMGAVGSHVAWNMMALGLLPVLFGGMPLLFGG